MLFGVMCTFSSGGQVNELSGKHNFHAACTVGECSALLSRLTDLCILALYLRVEAGCDINVFKHLLMGAVTICPSFSITHPVVAKTLD